MLYTVCAIVRRRLEQEKNPERRETILEMLDLLESPENLTKRYAPLGKSRPRGANRS